jgi:hypothetical protein
MFWEAQNCKQEETTQVLPSSKRIKLHWCCFITYQSYQSTRAHETWEFGENEFLEEN